MVKYTIKVHCYKIYVWNGVKSLVLLLTAPAVEDPNDFIDDDDGRIGFSTVTDFPVHYYWKWIDREMQ